MFLPQHPTLVPSIQGHGRPALFNKLVHRNRSGTQVAVFPQQQSFNKKKEIVSYFDSLRAKSTAKQHLSETLTELKLEILCECYRFSL